MRAVTLRTAFLGGFVLAVVAGAVLGAGLAGWLVAGWVGVLIVGAGLTLVGLFLWVLPPLVHSGLDATSASQAGRPALRTRVTRLAQGARAPVPEVSVVDDTRPNAATVGSGVAGTLFVTTGLLETLPDRELTAVLAHELAHFRHHDAALMTLLALPYVLTVGLLRGSADVGRQRQDGAVFGLLLAVPGLLLTVATLPLAVAFSRVREYAADRAAVAITGDPAALALALRRIERARAEQDDAEGRLDRPNVVGTLGVVADGGLPFSHPTTASRVDRLRGMERDRERR